ncbi:MAG: 7TM diverse intracellular signaling domain-containing protein [Pseudomonadota bacterium]|nr:7TM diverse intracellular signaling domain-containing protein [Pseudomonadota bacterium]
MPHQEHLPQAGGGLAHRSRLPGAAARLAVLIAGCLLLAVAALADAASAPSPLTLRQAEAVRGDWADAAPPEDGWTPVALPDDWAHRWPQHDGVVWYRLRWEQPDPPGPVGLLLPWSNMASAVWINGVEVHRDAHLTDPLSRAWHTPLYRRLVPPLLQPGENTVLVRVSGMAAYQGGLSAVTVGDPGRVHARYRVEHLVRQDLQLVGVTVASVIALFFGALWAMRPREKAYGWFSLMTFFWLLFEYNHVATETWPLPSTDAWQAANTSALLAFAGCFVLFVLRYRHRRLPRAELALFAVIALGCIDLWTVDRTHMALRRDLWTGVAALVVIGAALLSIVANLLSASHPQRALVPILLLIVGVTVRDLLVFLQVVDSTIYYSGIASHALLVGVALLLARRFNHALEHTETFNARLLAQVEGAKAQLRDSLEREHALKLLHARAHERVNLASDLHDGLGGMLVGSIATLEHAAAPVPQAQMLAMLKSLRDDLRLIIDATGQQTGLQVLGEVIAPLRHRITELFEASGIHCRWHLSGVDDLTLDASLNIGVLRFLQEALTNALKHSGARQVDVYIQRTRTHLRLDVRDDGRGFQEAALGAHAGNGLRNMRTRAERLGAQVQWQSEPGRTTVSLLVDLLSS